MPVVVTNGEASRSRAELAQARAIAQQVAQARVSVASTAAATGAEIEAVAAGVPANLADDIANFRRRLNSLEQQK